MELLIWIAVVVVVAIAGYIAVSRIRTRKPASPRAPAAPKAAPGEHEVVLPVDEADPDHPATKRLVRDAADRVLAANPDVTTVLVLTRQGRELARVKRPVAEPSRPPVNLPRELLEPHARRHREPRPPPAHEDEAHVSVRFREEGRQHQRPLADLFELPDAMRHRIGNPEDPVEIVRAIFDDTGIPAETAGNVIRLGDTVVVVLRTPLGTAVAAEDLNAAFLRFQESRARRGIVVTTGLLYPHDVRRREAMAPALRHAGLDGIQRMADAAAMGADPLDFVVLTPGSDK